MEEIKITPEESDMLLHGQEYKPGEEGELTDTGERITFPMSEAARAAENVSKSDTPGSEAGHSKIPVWGPKPELTFEFLENPDRYASLKTRIDQLRDLYGEEYDIKITVKDFTVNMAGIEMLRGMQF